MTYSMVLTNLPAFCPRYPTARSSTKTWYIGLALVYIASPLDLIPDWIPVIGWLDEMVVVPLLLAMARRTIPENVLADCRRKVEQSEMAAK